MWVQNRSFTGLLLGHVLRVSLKGHWESATPQQLVTFLTCCANRNHCQETTGFSQVRVLARGHLGLSLNKLLNLMDESPTFAANVT